LKIVYLPDFFSRNLSPRFKILNNSLHPGGSCGGAFSLPRPAGDGKHKLRIFAHHSPGEIELHHSADRSSFKITY